MAEQLNSTAKGTWSWVAGLFTGASIPAGLQAKMTWPGVAALIVAIPVILGIGVSLDAQDIALAGGRLLRGEWAGGPYYPAVLTWIVSGTWLLLLYLRVVTEDYARQAEIAGLKEHQHEEVVQLRNGMDAQMQQQAEAFQRAIFRSPNVDVIGRYPTLYRKAATTAGLTIRREVLEKIEAGDILLAKATLTSLEPPIRDVLLGIALMAKRFGRRPDDALYGCSLMLLETQEDEPHRVFRALETRPLRFADRSPGDYNGFRAVLYSTTALTVDTSRKEDPSRERGKEKRSAATSRTGEGGAEPAPATVLSAEPGAGTRDDGGASGEVGNEVSEAAAGASAQACTWLAYQRVEIALPVPRKAAPGYSPLFLPGPPLVLENGGGKVYPDVSQLKLQYEDFSRNIRAEIDSFFSPGDLTKGIASGPGAGIRSFASFRIGTDEDPIGVVNIDCDHTNLLGAAEEYSATFTALVTPWLLLLVRPVANYSWLQTKIWNAEPPSSVS